MLSEKQPESQPFLDNYFDAHHSDRALPVELRGVSQRTTSRWPTIKICALVFVLTSLAWMVLIILTSSYSRNSRPTEIESKNITSGARLLKCGDSVSEARQLGCRYDALLNNWVPSPCYDEEFLYDYMDDGSWTAYADEFLTQPITTIEEMSEREYYWTSVRDHVNHRAQIWRKQFYVLFEQRKAIDTMLANPAHTDHCAYYLMQRVPQTEATRVDVGYAGCWVRD